MYAWHINHFYYDCIHTAFRLAFLGCCLFNPAYGLGTPHHNMHAEHMSRRRLVVCKIIITYRWNIVCRSLSLSFSFCVCLFNLLSSLSHLKKKEFFFGHSQADCLYLLWNVPKFKGVHLHVAYDCDYVDVCVCFARLASLICDICVQTQIKNRPFVYLIL